MKVENSIVELTNKGCRVSVIKGGRGFNLDIDVLIDLVLKLDCFKDVDGLRAAYTNEVGYVYPDKTGNDSEDYYIDWLERKITERL